jgi:hypothetical protein
MAKNNPFFPGFHRVLFGRPPISEIEKITRKRGEIESLCLAQISALFGAFIPTSLLDFKADTGTNSRCRIFTPMVTFWGFLGQVLEPGSSCRKAVSNIQTLFAARDLELPSTHTKAYCNARRRLPVRLLHKIVDHVAGRLCAGVARGGKGRTLVVDGTAVTMPDTPLNQAKYPQHQQKKGCGFPIMKLVGLFCLDSGAWIATAKSHIKVHESRLFARLFRYLRPGDTLVTDRGFCSYWAAAMLMARGVDFVMRNHQKRIVDFRQGKRIGKGDHCIVWNKPVRRPYWISKKQYEALPDHLVVRETRLPAPLRKGFRTTTITVVSSFVVAEDKTRAELADYFMRRWRVELYFDDIKTSQAMDVLRTKSPALVCRELLMHMIAYNLIRAVALNSIAQSTHRVAKLERVSYKGTADRLSSWCGAIWSAPTGKKAREMVHHMHATIAEDLVPERPGRREPRVIKRRPKNYQFMTKPRHEMMEIQHRNVYRKPA